MDVTACETRWFPGDLWIPRDFTCLRASFEICEESKTKASRSNIQGKTWKPWRMTNWYCLKHWIWFYYVFAALSTSCSHYPLAAIFLLANRPTSALRSLTRFQSCASTRYSNKWLLPRKLTWNLKITPFKRKLFFQFWCSMLVFRGVRLL